jgi:competence ComEA-like helix-hairpin-helix protein
MTIKTRSGLRRIISLAAFSALIAAVTMAFADAPQRRTRVTLTRGEPALSISPAPAVRLAQAPTKKKKKSAPAIERSAKAALAGSLNLNTATVTELIKLPGIGPKKAALIVEWRKQHGSFGRVVDLRRVKGFGAKTVKKLLPYLATSGKNSLH